MLKITQSGSFKNTESYLNRLVKFDVRTILEAQAQRGVEALAAATPIESGRAAQSWRYEISQNGSETYIDWLNSDVQNGFAVAVRLQYGYGTGTGGYVQGRDYINPALKPIFDNIADTVWKAVNAV